MPESRLVAEVVMTESSLEGREMLPLNCSFCGKSQREVRKLIAGPRVYICDECIKLCNDIIWTEIQRQTPPTLSEESLASLARVAKRVAAQTAALSGANASPPSEKTADAVASLTSSLDDLFEALVNAGVPWPLGARRQRTLDDAKS